MKKLLKSLLSASLAATMLVSIAGCAEEAPPASESTSGSTSTSSDSTTTGTSVSEKGVLPIVTDGVELEFVTPLNASISDYEDNLFYNWMEEQTGITMNINAIPSSDITQKINLMLSSGQEMPDVFLTALHSDSISNYADEDIFVDISGYIDTQGDYLSEVFAENPSVKASITMDDGRILGLPINFPPGDDELLMTHSEAGGKVWVNQTWLDALDMDMPTTTDEFYDMLVAFRDEDPNGNGEKDEIPYIGAFSGGWDSEPEIFIFNSFLPFNIATPYYRDDNGTVMAAYAQPEYREALKFMNSLASEGLLDPVSYTQDNAQLKQLAEMETPVIGVFASAASSMAITPGTDRFKEYVALPPLEGPNGVKLTTTRAWTTQTNNFTAITTACENPEAAFKLLDFWHTDDAALFSKWGVEGEHWGVPADGSVALNGEPAQVEILQNLYTSEPTNARSGTNFGRSGRFQNFTLRAEDPFDPERYFYEQSASYFAAIPEQENTVMTLFYTPEDSQAMAEVSGTLNPYVNEARTKFILGTLDPNNDDDWNSYLADIEQIGYQTVVDVMQARHDIAS